MFASADTINASVSYLKIENEVMMLYIYYVDTMDPVEHFSDWDKSKQTASLANLNV